MNAIASPPSPRVADAVRRAGRGLPRRLFERQRTLTLFAALLLAAMVPAALAWGWDDRVLRGADVWIKPLKFMLSVAVLALTTAWFVGHLPPAARRGRPVKVVVALLVGCGGLEVAYIALQAALGEGSHYNVGDALHATLYSLMGVGALGLTATQPMLAWQLWRHPDPRLPPAYRLAVLLGLVFAFVLGAGIGGLLSVRQPPNGPGLPFFGWSTVGGDLRPAHFVGLHAAQMLPAAGAALAALLAPRRALRAVWLLALLYALACLALVVQALAGQPFIGG